MAGRSLDVRNRRGNPDHRGRADSIADQARAQDQAKRRYPESTLRPIILQAVVPGTRSSSVRRFALEHAPELERKVEERPIMTRIMRHPAGACDGDDRLDCPIVDDLAAAEDREEKRQ